MRLIPAVAIVLGWAAAAWAAAPATLTTLSAIVALSNAEADKGIPVAFEATVTYQHAVVHMLFVQEGDAAIFVGTKPDLMVTPGDRVLVRGTTAGSFHPIVVASSITVLRHGALLKAVPASYDELIRFQHDCMLVTVRGIVRAADLRSVSGVSIANLQLLTDGGYIRADVYNYAVGSLEDLLDAEVEITGVAAGEFDGKMQVHGVFIYSPSRASVKILQRARANPWTLPLTPMDMVITSYHVTDRTQRVRVHGTITYYLPSSAVVLQDSSKSLWISTLTSDPLEIGDVVDATGFPEAHSGFLALTRGEIQDSHVQAPIAPLPVTRKELVQSGHVIDLVSIEGQVVAAIRGGTQDEYHLIADGQMFTAIYTHPLYVKTITPMKQVPIGSRVRVAGICITENSNPFSGESAFDILMRNFDDIEIVAKPSLINTRNLLLALGLLLAVVFAVSSWGWTLRRKVRLQTAALAKQIEAEAAIERRSAQLERQRSRILEDINGSRPLAEILEEITKLVSFQLKDTPCWCQITDGARLGNHPLKTEHLRIIHVEIPARSGPPLGVIFVAIDPLTLPRAVESEALSMSARLATLAIETRRLYADLRRRSEFDLLTDIHNRFSLEKRLEGQIIEARENAGIFGLVYLDLNEFKQINDLYGHHIGDLYLQEVAVRMKLQLRSHDLLARLGGDEFVALLPMVRNRAGVEEIALRLEHCFDEPFALEGQILQGDASIGVALYPEDGVTRDDLLNAADAAMYAVKNARRLAAETSADTLPSDSAPVGRA
jgi:diguanylate cyclase (GGDEF)-like protein